MWYFLILQLERSSRGKDKKDKLSKKSLFKKPQGLRVPHMDLRKDCALAPVPDGEMYDSLKPQVILPQTNLKALSTNLGAVGMDTYGEKCYRYTRRITFISIRK